MRGFVSINSNKTNIMIGNTITTYREKKYRVLDKVIVSNNTKYLCKETTSEKIKLIFPEEIDKVL